MCMSATWTTRVRHEWNNLILIATRVKTHFYALVFTIWQVKDYKGKNNFILRTTFGKYLVSMPKCVWNVHHKTRLFKSCTLDCSRKCSCTLPHSYAQPHFRLEPFYLNTPTFFLVRTIESYTKWMLDSKRTFKIKVRLPWTTFEILLTSAIICIQRVLHGNEVVQYIQNYKRHKSGKGHTRKPL